ncbi:hypothetical protein JOC33_001012 [Thalassobacillus pellis]|nr:hypothetical protein [Thalassobacillus pellis]
MNIQAKAFLFIPKIDRIPDKSFLKFHIFLIKRGGGYGPVTPQQPVCYKVLIPAGFLYEKA